MSSAIVQDAPAQTECDIAGMRSDRQRIREWMEAVMESTDWTPNRWASIAKTTPTNITRFLSNEDASIPSFQTISKLAAVAPPPYHRGPAGDFSAPPPQYGGRDVIPIRSAGRGGDSQEMFTDDVVGYTSRPANLVGVLQGYAVYVLGDSMAPRYEPGWLLYIHPSKPPTKGKDVVVYKHDNSVLVKTFIEHTARELVLSQMNPPAEIRISSGDVKEFHLIVGVDQEGG